MRLASLVTALALIVPSVSMAQQAAPTATATSPTRSAAMAPITREQFVQTAEDRAAKRAATRFDQMDTNHDGKIDAGELAAWRAAHPRHARTKATSVSAPAQ